MTENSSFLPGDDAHEDVIGHRMIADRGRDAGTDETPEEDVEAHMQPPRDLDVERF